MNVATFLKKKKQLNQDAESSILLQIVYIAPVFINSIIAYIELKNRNYIELIADSYCILQLGTMLNTYTDLQHCSWLKQIAVKIQFCLLKNWWQQVLFYLIAYLLD